MDDESVDRILMAMKEAPGDKKIDFSRFEKEAFGCIRAKRALGRDIETMVVLCRAADGIRSRSLSTKHQTTLNRLDKVLKQGQAVLDADPETTAQITMSYPPGTPDLISAFASGRSVIAGVRQRFSDTAEFEWETHTFIVSLVGKLMIVFKDRFGAEPGYTKKDNEDNPHGPAIIDSPFIRFIEQACEELNITKSNGKRYTRAAFADAVRRARKLQLSGRCD